MRFLSWFILLLTVSGALFAEVITEADIVGEWNWGEHTYIFSDDFTYQETFLSDAFSYANTGSWDLIIKNEIAYLTLYDILVYNYTLAQNNSFRPYGMEIYFVEKEDEKLLMEYFIGYKSNHLADIPPTFFEYFDDNDPWGWDDYNPVN